MSNIELSEVPGALEQARPIIARAEQHDGSSPISDQALLAVAQAQRDLTVFTRAGEPVAVGVIGQGEVDLVVDPPARGKGIGSAALTALISNTATPLLAWAHGENPEARALLTNRGFRPVRSLYRMALDPARLPSDTGPFDVPLPEGFALRTFDESNPADAKAWVAVNARAFASHPEQGKITLEDFALMRQEAWFNPDDLFLLTDTTTGKTAGYTWVKTVRDTNGAPPEAEHGDTQPAEAEHGDMQPAEAELYAIGVDPAYAGSGIGRALLQVTLARMGEHDPHRVTLYVDGDNTRAVRMYEMNGFVIDTQSTQFGLGQLPE